MSGASHSPLTLVASLIGAAGLLLLANLVISGAAVLLLWCLAP